MSSNESQIQLNKDRDIQKNWFKFIISLGIFILSFNYITTQLRYQNIFPLNYFESYQYASQIGEFLNDFYLSQIELPKLKIPIEDIEVTKDEILEARFDDTPYYSYLYDESNGEYISISSLSDEQIEEIIRYHKYQTNQTKIDEYYETSPYDQQGAFYYDLSDRDGNKYTNLANEKEDYLNVIPIPYHKKNNENFRTTVNSFASDKGLSGTLYLPKYSMGHSSIQSSFIHSTIIKISWFIAIILNVILLYPIYQSFRKIRGTTLVIPSQYQWIIEKYSNLPIEFKGIIFVITLILMKNFHIDFYSYYSVFYIIKFFIQIIFILFILCILILQIQGIIHRLKKPQLLQREWKTGFYMSNREEWSRFPIYRNIFFKIFVFTATLGLWGVIWGMSIVSFGPFILITLASIMVIPILLLSIKKKSKNLQIIVDTLSKMANNKNTSEIIVKGHGIIADTSRDINTIREGFALSTQKQSDSERLKTELITNVSHDLRTPLTSILNYVDLAKRNNISEQERQEYLTIIDNKSKRLKVLIDDLFEASKMASGAVELQKEKVDLVALMYQTLAEYDDRFKDRRLVIKTKTMDSNMYAYCDGRKMARVFENLFSNIIKYAQPATRVYIEMTYEISEIVIIFKNISNYELGFNVSELSERFKRGDSSRHTEGSGLGLSIVKSILELHEAVFELSQDGDLFKVIIKIKRYS